MCIASRPASTRVNDFDIIPARGSHHAIGIKSVETSPASWWCNKLWVVLALSVAGDGLVELVGCAADGIGMGHAGCLTGAAASDGFDMQRMNGGVLPAGLGVFPGIGLGWHWWARSVVWVVGVVKGDLVWCEACCCCLGAADFDGIGLLNYYFGSVGRVHCHRSSVTFWSCGW